MRESAITSITSKKMFELSDSEFFLFKESVRCNKLKLCYDPRDFQGAYYWERGFLSCVIAGAKIPVEITPAHFRVTWNRIIFEALYSMRDSPSFIDAGKKYDLLVALLSRNPRFDENFKTYLIEIKNMIGIQSPIYAFAAQVIKLNAGIPV